MKSSILIMYSWNSKNMAAELAQAILSQSTNLQDRVVELEGQVSFLLKFRLDAIESGKKPHEDWEYSAPNMT